MDTGDGAAGLWEQPHMVARMADRPPDRRLVQLLDGAGSYAAIREAWQPGPAPRVLDLGCAGGRNTVLAAQRGLDVWALDASRAMVRETRKRLAPLTGESYAQERVLLGRMAELDGWTDGFFDLVIALGVLQDAGGYAEWSTVLAGIGRVLRPGGLCLLANFGPDSEPAGRKLKKVPGEPFTYGGFGPGGRLMTLPDLAELDAEFAAHGFTPALPGVRVRRDGEEGFRTTFNALYRRQDTGPEK